MIYANRSIGPVASQCLLVVGDNSFCNRTLFTAALERTAVIARARRDVKLCKRAPAGSRCFYDATRFTPEPNPSG